MPLISIIIPTFNAESYIARCLESCINQTLRDIEILIIDDCGSDDSIQIAKDYASKDKRIKIIQNPKNLGTFGARKAGILQAKAEFCMFADPDDYFALDACQSAYVLITYHKTDMAQFGIDYMPKSFKRIKPIVHKGILSHDKMRYFLSAGNNTQSLCDKIIKTSILREALENLSFINQRLLMLEDGLLVLVASLHAQSYVGSKQCIYFYCDNPSSITKDKSLANFHRIQQQITYLLQITQNLKTLYPAHSALISVYQRKVASTLMIESRQYTLCEVYHSMLFLREFGFEKNCDIAPYLKATALSLLYAFRWQNLVRLLGFVCSFGKLRL